MKNIGIDVKLPEKECTDVNCPFHGHLTVRGQIIVGTVVSNKMNKSIVVRKESKELIKKYERYATKFSKYHAHLPDCIDVKPGDKVKIAECRKLAKTISFVVIEKVD
ncbi:MULTISPECIES: 30S ribosomal protein S17 [Acidiplasma]|uniref:Small ribosomal subunit protein uS17 n=2 Tax=Acidiplasma TaxID=507753 RepID=A0A0Q0WIV2_9ARCH|nr:MULTISPECIES: 30S ribosomal protein S17 [Acidiplasma]KJE49552.1 30S ribosomal protein S17 [Acidiplasma sp. MBA-1]KPV46407.1 30S ribosomal protein S17 [Acidiplasma aeolicum]KQB35541.1 30S ribosomal protein S17 [Acidiplasma cupricumulans]KQB36758.1 30S ribosomal protein S17 [Acidiplasma aeolicum]WMT54559.1 MAG: 30S ribosomal protein S17 [Acidiplasma sp.]